jgi:putative aldouronate transport system permease protein
MIRERGRDRLVSWLLYVLLALLGLLTVYPFWETVVISVSPFEDYLASTVHVVPRRLDFGTYQHIFGLPELWRSYGVTAFVTVVGTLISMFGTVLTAYTLSKEFVGKTVVAFLIVFTMFFTGGLIPNYIVVRDLGLTNTLWSLILPTAISTYYVIVLRSFFATLPRELEDAARIDGCSELGTLLRIVLPLSKAALATIGLFYAVGYWNAFFNAVMYISDRSLWPLQLFLRAMLFENEAALQGGSTDPYLLGAPIKMAAVVVGLIPIACVYPFLQRYFVKGVALGAVKG